MHRSRYEFLESVGQGSYGTLFRGVDAMAADPADAIVAGKKLKERVTHRYVMRELSIQQALVACRNVVTLLNVVPRDTAKVLLIMEFLPMNLREFMDGFACPHWDVRCSPGTELFVPLDYTKSILRGVLAALAELHARGIVHRDVKPENILIEPLGADAPLRRYCPCEPTECRIHHGWYPTAPSPAPAAAENNEEDVHAEKGGVRRAAVIEGVRGPVTFHHDLTAHQVSTALCHLHCQRCAAADGFNADGLRQGEREEEAEEDAARVGRSGGAAATPLRPHAKLGDFGSARSMDEVRALPEEERWMELTGEVTSQPYCAPEALLHCLYDEAVDMWAVGVIFFELVFGVILLPPGVVVNTDSGRSEADYSAVHRFMRLMYLLGTPTAAEWRAIAPPDYDESLRQSLPQQPLSQLFGAGGGAAAAAEAQTNPGSLSSVLLRLVGPDGWSFMEALLRYNPAERMTAADALRHPFLA